MTNYSFQFQLGFLIKIFIKAWKMGDKDLQIYTVQQFLVVDGK